jgi:pyruvate/2-oxoglutarate/acetoin dehydrogenase E1 component/TPP-dependent pyruvate/acetoin dehydrogenase alpha subunit
MQFCIARFFEISYQIKPKRFTMAEVLSNKKSKTPKLTKAYINQVKEDFRWSCISREASVLGRKEVLTGKAKFGIVGDGKEVAQVAMARAFKKGDWRSGYYRDQTIMFALGLSTIEQFFAQLYADHNNDPFSGGRQMNNHFATPTIDENGNWTNHVESYNISSDISSTGGQMARALGLAFASKKYRNGKNLNSSNFSKKGNEVVFCTIGDASTSEGVFWESINAAGVLQVPLVVAVWDDGYGISVPKDFQTTKGSISEVLSGFASSKKGEGIYIEVSQGWDYAHLRDTFEKATEKARKEHKPVLVHVKEVTQPQGHSTSGSHERYKSKERLQWEQDFDCIKKMSEWMVEKGIASQEEINTIQEEAVKFAREGKAQAWKNYTDQVKETSSTVHNLLENLKSAGLQAGAMEAFQKEIKSLFNPVLAEILQIARRAFFLVNSHQHDAVVQLKDWLDEMNTLGRERYEKHLYSESDHSVLKVPVVPPVYDDNSELKNGYEILNTFFDKAFESHPELFAFGEDVGQIGGVNQGFMGMQEKYGEERIFDVGIREWTIMGQAIGMAMRGLRPIGEIQYLDYLIYGLEPLMDDLATLRWRSNGLQKAPAIIRTRGHRLEGIWHAGSPLGMIINSLRGMHVCTPRNMTQAAGMYNTLILSDEPGLVIECLNGYRLKEKLPNNIGEFTVPLGVPEILQEGTDITLVTYGSCVRVAEEGIKLLEKKGISVELIDVQTLLPFDTEHIILSSLQKTNRILFMDEDVPGGATAYMMQKVMEEQGGYRFLDSAPTTLSAKAHRPPYGSDGDYFSKPNPEDVYETVTSLVWETEPWRK